MPSTVDALGLKPWLRLQTPPPAGAWVHQWQQAVLQKLEKPVDMNGNPWPLDDQGKPIV